ncbi:MAG: S24/S26 family peptidase [Vicinamibacterales bacterium]
MPADLSVGLSHHMPQASLSTFVEVSSDLLSSGYRVRFRASGSSMHPAICDGDVITVEPIALSCLAPGSVVVYRRFNRLFAHRLVRIETGRSGAPVFVCRGDAASACDAPVAADQILGEVGRVQRLAGQNSPGLLTALGRVLRASVEPALRMRARFAC